MLPLDAGAAVVTWSMYSVIQESTKNDCEDVRVKLPWE